MKKILITYRSRETANEIHEKIQAVNPGIKITKTNDIERAIKFIKDEKPAVVVADFNLIDKNGKNILARLETWDFTSIIYDDDEFYLVQDDKKGNKQGYILKQIEDFDRLLLGGL